MRKMVKVAILIENLFEDSEFQIPYQALQRAQADTVLVGSRMNDEYQGKHNQATVKPDATATEVRCEDFDAIIIPGGAAPDRIRANPNAVRLVMNAMAQGKLIAAICHGIQVLIEADQLRDKRATVFPGIRKDIENAGAIYVNEPVVTHANLITARQPGDLAMFTTTILKRLGLTIDNMVLPEINDDSYQWWQLAANWGGSTRSEIIQALNTAITGESYTLKAFELYQDKVSDPEIKTVFSEVQTLKQQHLEKLETRLADFGEQVSWQTIASDAIATIQNLIESSDNLTILRRALGNIQTGVVDAYQLSTQITDPVTVDILIEIEHHLALLEQRLGDLYRARAGEQVKPPMPSTIAAVN